MANHPALFPETTENDWRRLAGAAADRATVTDDGIRVAPIYPRATDAQFLTCSAHRPIVQRMTATDADGVASQAAAAIAGGARGIEIVFASSVHPMRSQLPLAAAKRLAATIGDVPGNTIEVRVDAGDATLEVGPLFLAAAKKTDGRLTLAFDPVVAFAARASSGAPPLAKAFASIAALEGTHATAAIADGRLWHAAGASEVQELAAVLATLVAYLRASSVSRFNQLGVALAADASLFPTIAKFRAMRLLVARLAELVDAHGIDLPIHAETAWRMTTASEPRMNALRGTIATVAAIAGCADSLTVLPYDAAGDTTDDSRRLAVNTQTIATAEAQLGRVWDPGAGSGAIEALTAAFAEMAWAEFQAIEGQGGFAEAAGLARMSTAVARTREARLARVESGNTPLVGVNIHTTGASSSRATTTRVPEALLRFAALDEQILVKPASPR